MCCSWERSHGVSSYGSRLVMAIGFFPESKGAPKTINCSWNNLQGFGLVICLTCLQTKNYVFHLEHISNSI